MSSLYLIPSLVRATWFYAVASTLSLTLAPHLKAESKWPGFLGPNGVAIAPDPFDGVPPLFGKDKENVLWKIPAGTGHSSPCIWDHYLFLTKTEDAGRTLIMTAYDRSDGTVLWQHQVKGKTEDTYGHQASDPAAPTPCTDGEHVFFYFGGYGLIACEMATGELAWENRFDFTPRMFGTGNSPVLFEDSIILARDGGEDSALWCFDTKNGGLKWKSPRPGLGHSYASAFVWQNRERTEVVLPGTNCLNAYDPTDGSLLWSVDDLCIFPCTTPTGDLDRLYFAAWATPNADGEERNRQNFWGDLKLTDEEASDSEFTLKRFDKNSDGKIARDELPNSRGLDAFNFVDRDKDGFWSPEELARLDARKAPGHNLMVAVEAGHDGELSEDRGIAWTFDNTKALPYVPTPLLLNGRIHLIKSGGIVACLDAATGEPVYGPQRSGVSGEYYASPVAWGHHVLLCAHRGTVLVLQDGEEFKVLAQNEIGEAIYATPAIVDGTLYLRSAEHLWAIGR